MSGVSGRDDKVDTIRIAGEKRAIEIGANFNVYTDDSVSRSLLDGEAGVLVTRVNPTSPKVVKKLRRRGARFTCSYEKENWALEEAVHWLQTGVQQNSSVAVFTDSQSVCAALLGKSTGLDPFRFNTKGFIRQITIQWIPGHSNSLGNEIADSVAKQECSENGQLPGVTYPSICAEYETLSKIHLSNMNEQLRFIARTIPPENARYEAEETKLYWQNSVLESTKDYALTKAS